MANKEIVTKIWLTPDGNIVVSDLWKEIYEALVDTEKGSFSAEDSDL